MCHINYIKKMYWREATFDMHGKTYHRGNRVTPGRYQRTSEDRVSLLSSEAVFMCVKYVWVVASDTVVTVIDIACSITVPVV